MSRPSLILCLALALVAPRLAVAQSPPCPSSGLVLGLDGGRLGDAWALGVLGNPYLSGVLGIDTGGGPVPTPFGNICLDFSPNLSLIPITLDSSGIFGVTGVLPLLPSLTDVRLYLQAAVGDSSQPSGLALSNGASVRFRPPRLYFISPGFASPFGTTPGSITMVDVMTDTIGFTVPLASSVLAATRVPSLGVIALALGNGGLLVIDELTGATVGTAALPTAPGQLTKLLAVGDRLVGLWGGTPASPFGGGTPGMLRAYDALTLSLLTSVTTTGINAYDMLHSPGTTNVYVRGATSVMPIDVVAGTSAPPVSVGTSNGSIVDWALNGSALYCLMGGTVSPFGPGAPPALNAVDTFSNTTLFSGPTILATSGTASNLWIGPGTQGTSIFAYVSTNMLLQYAPSTLFIQASVPLGGGVKMVLSPGGTEWLLLCAGGPCAAAGNAALLSLDPASLTLSTVSTFPVGLTTDIVSIKSDSMRKGYIVATNNIVAPFPTDPAGPPSGILSLPISSTGFKILGND